MRVMFGQSDRRSTGKVLIAAPSFRDYGAMIGCAFQKEGWESRVHCDVRPALSIQQAIRWTTSTSFRAQQDRRNGIQYNREIQRIIRKMRPDLCLVINGDTLDESTTDCMKKTGVRSIVWCYDSITQYPKILDNILEYDHIYAFEPTDIPIIRSIGACAEHLPMGYDPNQYYPIPQTVKKHDISFVGSVFSYPNRMKLLKRVVKDNRDLSVCICTNTPPHYSPRRAFGFLKTISAFSRAVEMRTLTHQEVNNVYNSSRICLNVHHPQCKDGLNPRTFEIAGSGSLQLVDYHKQIDTTFSPGKEAMVYRNHEELQTYIEYCLENPMRVAEISERAQRRAYSSHTYLHRVKRILNDCAF